MTSTIEAPSSDGPRRAPWLDPTAPVMLALLLPAVLQGCYALAGGRQEVDESMVLLVPEATMAEAVDDFGELTPEGCQLLCALDDAGGWISSKDIVAVHSCAELPTLDEGDRQAVNCSVRAVVELGFCGAGRAHASAQPRPTVPASTDPVREWLSRAGTDEATSVGAFRRLARELREHGAPAELVSGARAAAWDEIRHARVMRDLSGRRLAARAFGSYRRRPLPEIALENAVEGCVRETFGALCAHHQAGAAADRYRHAFRQIADDETRHGQWSWDLDAWLRSRLSSDEARSLDQATRAAIRQLRASVQDPHPDVVRTLGVPSSALARQLVDALFGQPSPEVGRRASYQARIAS